MKRVLCLRFSKDVDPSWAEAFLRWTPQVVARPPNFLFLEISETASLFGGELSVLEKSLRLAEDLSGAPVRAAIAGTPYEAQVRSFLNVEEDEIPLVFLTELEGLAPWLKKKEIFEVATFFESLGLKFFSHIKEFSAESFRERWGALGLLMWRRLHGKETQVISPLLARDPFYGYLYFENSPLQVPMLLNEMTPVVHGIFARLAGRGRFAKFLEVVFHCEYSQVKHEVKIEPVSPSRDHELFMDLLGKKIEKIDLLNPVKEVEIFIQDTAEKSTQMDFFEPRESSKDRWQRFMSFAAMTGVQVGFLEKRPGLYPENTVAFKQAEINLVEVKDAVEAAADALRLKPAYAKGLQQAPRPSLLLKTPRPLGDLEMSGMRFLTPLPIERLIGEWWKEILEPGRDYYFAVAGRGQVLWIFRDRQTRTFFLHGAFD